MQLEGHQEVQHTIDPRVREFAMLTLKRRVLEALLTPVKERLEQLQEPVLGFFEREGIPNLPLTISSDEHAQLGAEIAEEVIERTTAERRITPHIRRQIWATANGDKPAAIAALLAAGLGEFVNQDFNVQSLSAYVRELNREAEQSAREAGEIPPALEEVVPEQFAGAIKVTERATIVA